MDIGPSEKYHKLFSYTARATILSIFISSHVFKALQLIGGRESRSQNLRASDIEMLCSDFTYT